MLDEKLTLKNFEEVRKGELLLFERLRKAMSTDEQPDVVRDLKYWQLRYFGHTDLNTPISDRIYHAALAINLAKELIKEEDNET